MKNVIGLLVSSVLCISLPLSAQQEQIGPQAQQQTSLQKTGYIADELILYMHTGPGSNFRILGSIVAGSEVVISGRADNNYTQIIDPKGRTAWVESEYVSTKPGLRFVVAELNEQLDSTTGKSQALNSLLSDADTNTAKLIEQKRLLSQEIAALKNQLAAATKQVKEQDQDIKTQWFFNGSIVLSLGLILGFLLTRLGGKRRQNMDNWK